MRDTRGPAGAGAGVEWQAADARPQAGVNGQAEDAAPLVFDPSQLLHNDCSAVMSDGLVFSVPSEIPQQPFSLEIGGRLGAALFQQISIHFDSSGQLMAWERRRFQPDLA